MSRPIPTRIFHITPIANLAKVFAAGEIYSKNMLIAMSEAHESIAHTSIQSRRATKKVTIAPGGVIHDYVPFYFAPRSPMLYAIRNGKVEGCPWRQQDIVHIESTVERVVASGGKFVIYPLNAALDYSAECFNNIEGVNQVDWPIFFEEPLLDGYSRYFHSRPNPTHHFMRMEKRQAEFLIYGSTPLSVVTRIGIMSDAKRIEVAHLLSQHGVKLSVEVKSGWYF